MKISEWTLSLLLVGCGSDVTTADAGGADASVAQDAGSDTATDSSATQDGGADSAKDATPDVDTSPLKAETKTDLVFRVAGKQQLAGDLYLPDRTTPVAAVIVIHGGGFVTGDKAGNAEAAWTAHLTSKGFAAFSVNYRLIDDFKNGDVPFPASGMDIKCAVSWLRMKASTYRIDPNHIFAFGSSAGGFMSNFIGTTGDEAAFNPTDCADNAKESNRVQGVVTYFGPSDWNLLFNDPARAGSDNGEKRLIGLSGNTPCAPNPADAKGVCKTLSATTYADAKDPPFFITHSEDDPVVPFSQGAAMKAALDAAKVNVTYKPVNGLKHGWHANFKDPTSTAVRDEVIAWLNAHK